MPPKKTPHSKSRKDASTVRRDEITKSQSAKVDRPTRNGKQSAEQPSEALSILKPAKPEIIWTHDDFARELKKAKGIGPRNMSNDALVIFCCRLNSYYRGRFLMDARPFFVELWRRIEKRKLRMSKTGVCRQIGCTRQWANAIDSGRADARREERKKAQLETKFPVSSASGSSAVLTAEEYIDKISKYAFSELNSLLRSHWDLYRTICEKLGHRFIEASKTPPVEKALAAGAN